MRKWPTARRSGSAGTAIRPGRASFSAMRTDLRRTRTTRSGRCSRIASDVVVYDFRNHGWNAVGALEAHAIPTFVDDMTRGSRGRSGFASEGSRPLAWFHSLSGQTAAIEACSGARSFAALVLFDPFICPQGLPPGPQGPPEENHGPDGRRGRGGAATRSSRSPRSRSGCSGRRRSGVCAPGFTTCWRGRRCARPTAARSTSSGARGSTKRESPSRATDTRSPWMPACSRVR